MRKLYSQRNFGNEKPSFEIIKELFLNFFQRLINAEYLRRNFGYWDSKRMSFVNGELGNLNFETTNSIDKYFLLKLKREIYPNEINFEDLSQKDFFDVVEFIFDLISAPIIGVEKSNFNKVHFDKKYAQKEYIKYLDEILNDFGFEMRNGEIWELPQQGMERLVEEITKLKKPNSFEDKIQHALKLFFDKNSTKENKRSSCETLGGILEEVRSKLPIPKKDVGILFTILNEFSIRHQKKDQGKSSKEELEWAFYTLLNTINHFLKIKK